jgi:hypothetical protein
MLASATLGGFDCCPSGVFFFFFLLLFLFFFLSFSGQPLNLWSAKIGLLLSSGASGFRSVPNFASSSSSPSSSSPSSAPANSPVAAAGLGGLAVSIAASAEDSVRGVRLVYIVKAHGDYVHTIWASTMLVWCSRCHDRL